MSNASDRQLSQGQVHQVKAPELTRAPSTMGGIGTINLPGVGVVMDVIGAVSEAVFKVSGVCRGLRDKMIRKKVT